MKSLKLTFPQRVPLANFLALTNGPLGKMAALQRVFAAIRPTEDEIGQCNVKDLGNGKSSIVAPTATFGSVEALVEDADAQVLAQEITAHQGFQIADLEWVNAVNAQLAAPSVAAKRRK